MRWEGGSLLSTFYLTLTFKLPEGWEDTMPSDERKETLDKWCIDVPTFEVKYECET